MTSPYLHGIDAVSVERGARSVQSAPTAVIGLVGSAPIFAVAAGDRSVNRPVLVRSDRDAAQLFGPDRPGYTIPSALRAIFDQGAGLVIVVNVFDPAVHKTAVAAAPVPFGADDRIVTGHLGLQGVVVRNQALSTTYVAGTDYDVDAAAGIITRRPAGAIAAGATVSVSYERADPTLVTSAHVIGGVDVAGLRTGCAALRDAASLFGFGPKVLVAPGYGAAATVAAELVTQASALRAVALIDAPAGVTVPQAIAGRQAGGAINFAHASPRALLCYPHVRVADPTSAGGERLEPLSPRLAGLIARTDAEEGYWTSFSSRPILGIIGLERRLTASLTDRASDVQLLNAAGIVTVYNDGGTFLAFGVRSAAHPTSSSLRVQANVQRTEDAIRDQVERVLLRFLDRPITDGLVDAILEDLNAHLRSLQAVGAIYAGRATFDPTKNPAAQIAGGELVFDVAFMPSPALETIEFQSVLDASLLSGLGARSTV